MEKLGERTRTRARARAGHTILFDFIPFYVLCVHGATKLVYGNEFPCIMRFSKMGFSCREWLWSFGKKESTYQKFAF